MVEKEIPKYDFRKRSRRMEFFAGVAIIAIAAVVLLLLGILYFMATIWMIKIGASWAGFKDVSSQTIIITAGIITAAVLIGSSMQKR